MLNPNQPTNQPLSSVG